MSSFQAATQPRSPERALRTFATRASISFALACAAAARRTRLRRPAVDSRPRPVRNVATTGKTTRSKTPRYGTRRLRKRLRACAANPRTPTAATQRRRGRRGPRPTRGGPSSVGHSGSYHGRAPPRRGVEQNSTCRATAVLRRVERSIRVRTTGAARRSGNAPPPPFAPKPPWHATRARRARSGLASDTRPRPRSRRRALPESVRGPRRRQALEEERQFARRRVVERGDGVPCGRAPERARHSGARLR